MTSRKLIELMAEWERQKLFQQEVMATQAGLTLPDEIIQRQESVIESLKIQLAEEKAKNQELWDLREKWQRIAGELEMEFGEKKKENARLRSVLSEFEGDKQEYVQMIKADAIRQVLNCMRGYLNEL